MSLEDSATSVQHNNPSELRAQPASEQHGLPKLNPAAAEFQPPRSRSENTPSNSAAAVTQSDAAPQSAPPRAARHDSGRSGGRGRHGGGEGSVKGYGARGGLSRAFSSQNSSAQTPPRGGRGGGRGAEQRRTPASGGSARKHSDSASLALSRSPGNANYLLGFHYEERSTLQSHSGRVGGSGGRGSRRPANSGWRPKPYNKEHFLQANFRFVVSDGVDVRRYMEHADRMFDWEDVLQVEVSSPTAIQCPISLESPPIVPVLTSCGHIFSLHSIVHHMLQSGGEKFCRASACPLCFNSISVRDLRLVTVRRIERLDFSQPVSFSLIRRPKNSILPQAEDAHTVKLAYDPVDPLASERFAKFVTVADPLPLFRSAATALAHYAADVLSAGGLEAEIEGPCLFKAMDVLVLLARKWAVRRAELLDSGNRSMVVGADGGNDNAGVEDANRIENALRDIFMIELADEKERTAAQQVKAHKDAEFEAEFPSFGGTGATAAGASSARAWPNAREPSRAWAPPPTALGANPSQTTPLPADASRNNEDMTFEFAFGDDGDGGGESDRDGASGSPQADVSGPGQEQDDAGIELLGSSPNQALSVNQLENGSHYFLYQSSDGQWLFMHPINVRCLLNHYKKFSACPTVMEAKVIEVEDMTQTEAVRKKMQALSHLPLTAEFKLCEVDLSPLLPDAALAPFKAELQQRAKLRAKRAAMARRSAARDAAAAAEEANPRGPTIEDLSRMPLPHEIGLSEQELAESMALQASVDEANSNAAAGPSSAGPSYATLTRLGLAATGPALGVQPTRDPQHPSVASPPLPRGAWGAGRGHAGSPVPAARTWGPPPPAARDEDVEMPVMQVKNKRGQKVLRLTSGGR